MYLHKEIHTVYMFAFGVPDLHLNDRYYLRTHVSDAKLHEMDATFACNDAAEIQINLQVITGYL